MVEFGEVVRKGGGRGESWRLRLRLERDDNG